MSKEKLVFTTKDQDGNSLELAVKKPTPKINTEAQKHYNRKFRESIDSGALIRPKAQRVLKEQGLWDDEKEKELNETAKTLREDLTKFDKIEDIAEKTETAKKIHLGREKLSELSIERNELDSVTAEYQAEYEKLNFLVAVCTVYNTNGNPYFKNLEDYYERAGEQSVLDAVSNFLYFANNIEPDFEDKYPENVFAKSQNIVF